MNATEKKIVVIDGAGVPADLYEFVKARARATGENQLIGFHRQRPADLQIDIIKDDPDVRERKHSAMRERDRLGIGCAYIIGADRETLRQNFSDGLSMILWITPHAD